MNIAILGGRFDPPHLWHFWTAQQVLESIPEMDEVWLLPDYTNALKPIHATPEERFEMLRFMETGRIKTSTLAIGKATVTYTIDIVKQLTQSIEKKFFWIVGSDALSEFSRWREYHKLSRMIHFLVFPRKDYPVRILPPNFRRIEGNLILSNLSSTLIRNRIKNGLTIDGLVFPEVREFILKKNLYR